jgi:hypothetical protein
VTDATGIASVLGNPSPGKEVMRRLTPCGWPAVGGVAMGAAGISAVVAMITDWGLERVLGTEASVVFVGWAVS